MTKYYAIDPDYSYSENTAEYGFGDYPEKLALFLGVVAAASRREAISKIKKIHKQASGCKLYFSGGGGGQAVLTSSNGSGGAGGGTAGLGPSGSGTTCAGGTNTGGGSGGGGGYPTSYCTGNGGSGIVIIRYKFQ